MTDPAADSPMRRAVALCRRHVAAAFGFSALVNVLYIAPTLYMLQVYDRVVPTQGQLTLLFLTLVLLFALVTLSLLDRVRTRLLVRAGVQLDAALAPALLDSTLGRPDLPMARQALREFDTLRQTLSGAGVLALFDAPWTPIYIFVCFLVHPAIGAVALVGGTILPVLAWRNERATRTALERAQVSAANSYASQEAMLGGAEAVRALGMRRAMVARQLRLREAMLAQQTAAGFTGGNYLTATKFVRLALQSLALGLGALLAIDNQISAGAIFASSFLIARALAPIEQLIGGWKAIAQAFGSYRRLDKLLIETQHAVPATQLPAPRGAIALEGVTLLNDTRDGTIVSDVTLQIAPGEVVAMIGPSGAGKSTLARIIAGAVRPDRGRVRIDGADLGDWDPERLAAHVGYLPQEPTLFAGTIKENIARFRGELGEDSAALDAAAIAATERARARELVQRLPNGFDHQLKPGGRGLSAGQSQRVALARAMYGDPALLVLDEPNAHLDSEGDAALLAAIDHYKRAGHTILVVSHKLGILPVVDKLLLMRGGRVELFGPRDEVLQRIAPPKLRTVPAGGAAPAPAPAADIPTPAASA
ncbi:type I secretion system permease/ATPase [Sphingomonas sp. BK345]|uniref:type I secretion system permease/ATPase n=1 Tax=Sphingomonas sp. BK345 TaxID=2586980 RepID=UPI0018233756|nr:type I secretion system permease/ATPase [Sphingomonas sp. BK345]MBB3471869.1 ATP-binding cassette subfamily C protein [Sphingomonas sp. BK345]